MKLLAIWFALAGQLPETLPANAITLQVGETWVILTTQGKPIAEFTEIDGIAPTCLRALPSGKGVVFTAPRSGKRDGLFLKLSKQPTEDISLSDGYHAWVAVAPDENYLVVGHQASADSGPIGMHGANANSQLWRVPLVRRQNQKAVQLTDSVGCKSSPSFVGAAQLVYGHNSCRGTQGIEWLLPTGGATHVVVKNNQTLDLNPEISPDGRMIAFVRPYYRTTRVLVADWPRMKTERVLVESSTEVPTPSIAWLTASRALAVVVDGKIEMVSADGSNRETIWRNKEGQR